MLTKRRIVNAIGNGRNTIYFMEAINVAVLSMTGFGRGTAQTGVGSFVVEVRTVNNRYVDLTPRLPREWSPIELRVREQILQRISRGKIDLWVQYTPPVESSVQVEIGEAILTEIVRCFRTAGERLGMAIDIPWGDLLKIPGVLTVRQAEMDFDALFEALKGPLTDALDQLNEMRGQEGRALAQALEEHLATMRRATDAIEAQRGSVLEKQRERLHKLVEQLRPEAAHALSDDRLEAEVLLFADRSDITEEIVRLRSHFDAFEQLLRENGGEPAGKRLEFIAQEMLREANTIGSKARDTEINRSVVELKHETEKIREQLQNLE